MAGFLILSKEVNAQSRTTKGTEFWIAYMDNLTLVSNGPPRFHIFVSADVKTQCTVTLPARTYSVTFTVGAGQTYDYKMDSITYYYGQGDDTFTTKGIKLVTDNPVEVRTVHFREYFSDGTLVLPTPELTDQYMIMSKNDTSGSRGYPEFVVLATADNTVVDFNLTYPSAKGNRIFKRTINAGETYQVQNNSDLTGSLVTAENGNKIAVFSGANYTIIKCGATNHIYDEDIPLKYWGTYYSAIPFKDQVESYQRILAANDSTIVHINCNTITLNRSQYWSGYFNSPEIISSNKPIEVAQFVEGGYCDKASDHGDPNMLILQPLTNMLIGNTFYMAPNFPVVPPMIKGPTTEYLTIVCQTKDIGLMKLDGKSIKDSFTGLANNPMYSYATLNNSNQSHTIYSDSFYYAYVYELSVFDAVTYSLGYGAQRPIVVPNSTTLIKDTTLCQGQTWKIDLTYLNEPVLWQDGDTSKIYSITKAGNYSVKSTGGCVAYSGQFKVSNSNINLSLPSDTALCQFSTYSISLPNNGQSYTWQDSTTGTDYTISQPGTYWVQTSNGQCALTDTIHVQYDSIPPRVMPSDTALCTGDSFVINATKISGAIKWQDGSTNRRYTIKTPGDYTLQITNGCGLSTQNMKVSKENLQLNLGGKLRECENNNLSFNIFQKGCTYLWSDGTTLPTFNATKSGKYWATKKIGSCKVTDTVIVTYDHPLPNAFLPADTQICKGDTMIVNLDTLGAGVSWSDGSTSLYRKIIKSGTYTASISNACGSSQSTMVVDTGDCYCKPFIPNSFTPNNDGRNEIFNVEAPCNFVKYTFRIYNTWGEEIFNTSDPKKGWDGKFKDVYCPEGVYIWQFIAKTNHLQLIYNSGTVTIVH